MSVSEVFHNLLTIFKIHWKFVVIVGIPFSLLPLAVSGDKAFQCVYVIGIVSVFWITEVMDLAVTSLIPIVLFPIFGILTPSEVASNYMKDVDLMLIGGHVLARTFQKQNLSKRIGLRIMKTMGPNPIYQYMGYMLATWFLSMWISNTASTAIMLTLTDAFVEQWTVKSSGRLEKNSIVDIREIINSEIEEQVGRGNSTTEILQTEPETSPDITKGLLLSIAYSAACGGIATVSGTDSNLIFYGFMEKKYRSKVNLNFGTFMLFSLPVSMIILGFVWFILCARYIGLSSIFKKNVDFLRKRRCINYINKELDSIGPMSYGEISTLIIFILLILLWVLREPGIPLLGNFFTYKNSKGEYVKYWNDSVSAILAALVIFNFPAKNPFKTKDNNEKLMDWKYIEKRFSWGIIILLGGGFSIAAGCEASGLSTAIGTCLTNLKGLPPFAILLTISFAISILTEFASNSTTVAVVLPIMLQMAECSDIHPMRMGLTVTIASSFSFCLPAATPPNAIIFSTGKLKVIDMVTSGLILNFVFFLLLSIMTYYYSIPIFHTDMFPDWITKNCSKIQNIT